MTLQFQEVKYEIKQRQLNGTKSRVFSHFFTTISHFSSKGVIGAKAATLTFMVGGPEKEFAAAKPVLSGMGKNIVYCGPIGSGQAVKICNNMLLGISMMGVSEAMNLGMR